MTDREREKVLHGLNSCGNDYGIPNICEVTECPYREDDAWCVHELAHDAGMLISELMKKNEAVEPTRKPEIFDSLYFCGACSAKVGFQMRKDDSWRFKYKYCPNCGKAVKWNDE